jgi:hypothetical protein
MSKLNCVCGWQISDVGHPSQEIGNIVTQCEFDANEPEKAAQLIENGREIWECSQCGRLGIEFPRGSNNVKWYAPADGKSGHLMRPASRT